MSTVPSIVPEFVESFPSPLQPGVLYVSVPYSTAAHLCCCGCGNEVVTPLSRSQWVLTLDGRVSLRPSIGNWALPCRSHYIIERGQVQWARTFTESQIRTNREDDRRLLAQQRTEPQPTRRSGFAAAIVQALHRIWPPKWRR
ncbi:DUF6527 family protein [Dactylosporangium sp. CA-139066]|uniref:DUF6527 family protein n=1 Tax=Dactylosporangium sp. CA-139066 TaxID=3239930 RepID=UPI003D8C36D3